MALRVEDIYKKYIKKLSIEERLQLMEITARDLADNVGVNMPKKRSLLELEGLGAGIWKDIDAQKYIDSLRSEWDARP